MEAVEALSIEFDAAIRQYCSDQGNADSSNAFVLREYMENILAIADMLLGLSATKAEELSVLQVCNRAFLVYLILIVYVRIGKKRFLGSATAFDAILVIVIGSIASRAISGTAPFVASLAGTLVLILTHWIISYITVDHPRLA